MPRHVDALGDFTRGSRAGADCGRSGLVVAGGRGTTIYHMQQATTQPTTTATVYCMEQAAT